MKKTISFLLALSLMLGLLAGCGGNSNTTKDTTPPEKASFSGKGTASDPYQIASADDLCQMAQLVNTEDDAYRNAHYILTADIDLGGEAWTPIGDGYLDGYKAFPGTFDGDGHTIRGLNVSTNAQDKTRFFGLFGQVEGTVKNLTIAASTIDCSGKDSTTTGAIVGCVYFGGTIENCHVSSDVTVTGSYTTGGVVGQVSGVMTNCSNAASVTGTSEVGCAGGLAGQINGYNESETDGTVSGCSNTGVVVSAGTAGGVAGQMLCGKLSNSTNSASVTGLEAGGILGVVNATQTDGSVSDYTVSGCTNSGSTVGTDYAGGITARVFITTGNVAIENCSNTAPVLAATMGGILGAAQTSTDAASLSVANCTNSGELANPEGDGTVTAGGMAASITCKSGGSISFSGNINTGIINAGTGRAGGILGTYSSAMSDEGTTVTLDIANCTNEAGISGGAMGIGGILGELSTASYPAVSFTVSDSANSGDLFGNTANVRMGGIVGVIEPHHCTGLFSGCSNSGNLSCADVVITEGEEWFDFSAAMGGILGYAGVNGVSLTPEDDCGLGNTTVLTFTGCESTGTITTGNEKITYYTGDLYGLSVVGTEAN